MTETTRRERLRAETERDILRHARALLVAHGHDAVTLRAIARELGVTAPALYRYYDSREDLLRRLVDEICADLAAELAGDLRPIPEDQAVAQVFAICRGFRRWALAHPQEFTLVFASAEVPKTCEGHVDPAQDQFGRIFLAVAGRVLAQHELAAPPDDAVPEDLRADLHAFRDSLVATLAQSGITLPDGVLRLGTAHVMLQFWVRLYGQVALEVFGRFPFAVSNPEAMFDATLRELAAQAGLDTTNGG